MRRKIPCLVAVVLLVAGLAGASRADSEAARRQRAEVLVEQAAARFEVGDFDKAIDLLKEAWDTWPYPEILFNLCQAYRMKKDYERAIFHCKGYLRRKPDTAKRAEVEALVNEMENTAANTAAAEKQTRERPPEGVERVGSGASSRADAAPTPASVAPDEDRAASPWYRDPLGWALLGGGIAMLATSGSLQATALSLHDDAGRALDPMSAAELQSRAEGRQTLALVVGGAGLVATLGGVWRLLDRDRPRGRPPAGTALDVRPIGSGAGLAVSGIF